MPMVTLHKVGEGDLYHLHVLDPATDPGYGQGRPADVPIRACRVAVVIPIRDCPVRAAIPTKACRVAAVVPTTVCRPGQAVRASRATSCPIPRRPRWRQG